MNIWLVVNSRWECRKKCKTKSASTKYIMKILCLNYDHNNYLKMFIKIKRHSYFLYNCFDLCFIQTYVHFVRKISQKT